MLYNQQVMRSAVPVKPIYTTSGDVGAYLHYPYLFNPDGDWIGWVTSEKQVYSVFGDLVGWLHNDFRILRKRSPFRSTQRCMPPPPPARFRPPARTPMPPLMAEVRIDTLDVLEECPDLLPTTDTFSFVDDID